VTTEPTDRALAEAGLSELDRVLAGPPGLSVADAAAEAGLPVETVLAQRRALGFADPVGDEPVITAGDLEGLRATRELLDAGLSEEQLLDFLRVVGRNLAQAADSLRSLIGDAYPFGGEGDSAAGGIYVELARRLADQTGPALGAIFTAHLRQLIRSEVVGRPRATGLELPATREVTVSFADLVGFTRLGEEVAAKDLGHIATRFAALAADAARPPVRLVKMIGDAAMFVAPDAAPVVAAALCLVESVDAEGEEFPAVRAGCATGAALNSGGDWFGQPVNLASRVTSVARPGSVLVTDETREAAGDGFAWSRAGRHRIRGVDHLVGLHRARPLAPEPA
jgi:adenylate cyclase